ncbi:TRAP transporter small permease [Photobacterium profundum]|uniref:TRAP transporter small permease protein n=1 Tax=Photobacterium profundum (strain SS9) TaxID=298386 RepID=Q6LH50_PHOPR|nr:TRAP transporter small permease [Photobacterium profundum]CAG23380.1 Hypothetical TRAP-type C4-dicarboxylate transport system, small permease component [Photobacterium profundum SS9]
MNISTLTQMVNRVLVSILILFMGLMVLTVIWQVFTRFIINDPSVFTDELSRYLLIWIGILGGAYTFSVKRHLALELLASRLSYKRKQLQSIFINILIIVFTYISLVYGGSQYALTTIAHQQVSPGLSIGEYKLLIGYVYMVIPISGVLIIFYGLLDILESFKNINSNMSGEE